MIPNCISVTADEHTEQNLKSCSCINSKLFCIKLAAISFLENRTLFKTNHVLRSDKHTTLLLISIEKGVLMSYLTLYFVILISGVYLFS